MCIIWSILYDRISILRTKGIAYSIFMSGNKIDNPNIKTWGELCDILSYLCVKCKYYDFR